jgi:hypothetical protein
MGAAAEYEASSTESTAIAVFVARFTSAIL